MSKQAIIIGAGPAGLTAAYELLTRTDIKPIILEKSGDIGGISKTANYKGNRMDIGGHRFFSKSDRVMQWWLNIMPIEPLLEKEVSITYQKNSRTVPTGAILPGMEGQAGSKDNVMLVRPRLSRIYFLKKLFSYPIQMSLDTLKKLGLGRTMGIMFSYGKARLFPRKPERNLEDFFVNRFGDKLYRLFFKDYTEKVWGMPCVKISAEWGAQRIKGISIAKALTHAAKSLFNKNNALKADVMQKETETSLIERFLYPKYGPGQLWEEVARQVEEKGGIIHKNHAVRHVLAKGNAITGMEAIDGETGKVRLMYGDFFFSTMPVQELISGMGNAVPGNVQEVAAGLQYRDFITVGVLMKKMLLPEGCLFETGQKMLPDTWIYVQEKDVKVGRLQIFNNWSPYMVNDPNTVWVGMEYFCNVGDGFWELSDEAIQAAAIRELESLGLMRVEDVLDSTLLRVEKTYPAYFGTYERFGEIREFTDGFKNLFLVGRNGMHKYNNSDHSMLTAMVAVDNIEVGVLSKDNIWAINTEQEYHEEKEAIKHHEVDTLKIPSPGRLKGRESIIPGSFVQYIWGSKWNKGYVVFALVAFLIQFVLFKFRYPFANYMPDSYAYLEGAYRNLDVNMWPVAYSKFLRLLSVFAHSDTAVVVSQYLFLQCSALLFLATLIYFIQPGKVARGILFVFVVLNPVSLYVSNYVSADALFIGLSLCWLTTLLWIVYQPSLKIIGIQAILLLACFTVRYNAIYYPVVAAIAFLVGPLNWKRRVLGIVIGSALVLWSVLFTIQAMQNKTGTKQFSAFGGWQLANNALYMYEHIPKNSRPSVPERFAKLDHMVREHMDTLSKVHFTAEDTLNVHFYLWSGRGPLVQYMMREWNRDSTTSYFKRWAAEGPLFADYGRYLIKRFPELYIKEFVLPNAIRLAVPPAEFLGTYNMGVDSVGRLAKEWFNYKSQQVMKGNSPKRDIAITSWYSVLCTLINALMAISLIGILLYNGFNKKNGRIKPLVIIVIALWLINMFFSVFASPIVLRYQVFPILIFALTVGVLMDFIYELNLNYVPIAR